MSGRAELVFAGGAPGSGLDPLVAELRGREGISVLAPFAALAIERDLRREATSRIRHPDEPWRGAPDWVAPTTAAFVDAVVDYHRARAGGGTLLVAHRENAVELEELARRFPDARFLQVVQDGRRAPDGWTASAGTPAARGLAWARTWSRHVAPAVACPETLGVRMLTVQMERLVAAPDGVLASVLGWLRPGRSEAVAWRGPRPRCPALLEDEALRGFASSSRAAELLALYDYEPVAFEPADGDDVELVLEHASALEAAGRVREAAERLARAHERDPDDRLLAALADAHERAGRPDEARRCRTAAIESGDPPEDACLRLLARPETDEALPWVARLRRSPSPAIRDALARWLVGRGLSPEAAEVTVGVEGRDWFEG